MHARLLAALVLSLLVGLLAPASALALRVHVRVEGVSQTIFGATQPLVTPFVGSIPVDASTSIDLTGPTPLGALEAASVAGEFYYGFVKSSFGPYVGQIGRFLSTGSNGWVFKVNGVSPPVGADSYELEDGDTVLWYYATFGAAGGPPTLALAPVGRGCYQAFAVDDAGARTKAERVTFLIDGRRVLSQSGLSCPGQGWHELRATRDGAIRSRLISRG